MLRLLQSFSGLNARTLDSSIVSRAVFLRVDFRCLSVSSGNSAADSQGGAAVEESSSSSSSESSDEVDLSQMVPLDIPRESRLGFQQLYSGTV